MYNNYQTDRLSAEGKKIYFLMQNAFISMYLLNNFSTVVDTAVKFSDIVGYTHRYSLYEEIVHDTTYTYAKGHYFS